MFITLEDAQKGTPISLNVAHIRSITPATTGLGSIVVAPIGSLGREEWVFESPKEILTEIARLSGARAQVTPAQYDAICAVIDRAKNDDRSLDTDEYASEIVSIIQGASS